MTPLVDFVLTSEECQAEKPSKQIFDAALKAAKCSVPSAGTSTRLMHPPSLPAPRGGVGG